LLHRLLCLGCSDVVIVGFDCIYPCIDGYRCMFIWSECLHLLSYDFFRKSGLQISIDDQCPYGLLAYIWILASGHRIAGCRMSYGIISNIIELVNLRCCGSVLCCGGHIASQ